MAKLNREQAEAYIYIFLQSIAITLDMYEGYEPGKKLFLSMFINDDAMSATMFNPDRTCVEDTYLIDVYNEFEKEKEPDEDLSDQPDG